VAGPIVTLAEAKTHLNLSSTAHDTELQLIVDAATPIVEDIVGPVMQETRTENHDGGGPFIVLRKRPVISVTSVVEYRGPITWTLTQASTPAVASTYSFTFEVDTGRVVRRVVGGGTIPFYNGPGAVHVVYEAGNVATNGTVPANFKLGALELIRHNYQLTQQPGHPAFAHTGMAEEQFYTPSGFAVPMRVIEILQAKKRAPSIA
jgi:hypothetical protein